MAAAILLVWPAPGGFAWSAPSKDKEPSRAGNAMIQIDFMKGQGRSSLRFLLEDFCSFGNSTQDLEGFT